MKKFISILLCYCILALNSGCQSVKFLSMDEASTLNSDKNFLVLNTPGRMYKITNFKFTTDSIEGDLTIYFGSKTSAINLYTQFMPDVSLDGSPQYLKISKSYIQKVVYIQHSPGKTAISIIAGILVLLILGSIAVSNSLDWGPISIY